MRHMRFSVAVAIFAASCIAFAQEPPSQGKRNSTRSMSDQNFLTKAAEGGMAEVEFGQLASKNGSSCAKQFGQRMVTDHSKANDQAKSLAAEKGITLPTSMSSKDQAMHRGLSSKNGSDFDKAYMTAMLKDHHEDIAEFRQEANSGTDPDIKAWAAKTLPTLEEHLRMAEDCAKQLGISTSTGGDLR